MKFQNNWGMQNYKNNFLEINVILNGCRKIEDKLKILKIKVNKNTKKFFKILYF